MDDIRFREYMALFEHHVVKEGIRQGKFGKEAWMPIRDGRLTREPIARLVGTRFSFEKPAVLEYYGLHKRSTTFMEKARRMQHFMKGFKATVVNISSIKDMHIVQLAPELLHEFPAFKQKIVETRFG